MKSFLAVLAALWVMVLASQAEASHFRYGNITYTIPDPIQAPRTVRFEVVVAWRKDYPILDSTSLNFGDGNTNPADQGVQIGTGTDASGNEYTVQRYTVTHTYPAPGIYTASFTSCCRLSNLINAADNSFLVTAKVDVTPGNRGNPVSVVPAVHQLQVGGVRTIQIPAVDPDGTPVSCRFATTAESSIGTPIPAIPANGNKPTLTPSVSPPGCTLTWNTTGGMAQQQYAVQIVLESANKLNGNVGSAVLDFMIELVQAPPPTCAGSTAFTVDMGQTITTDFIGTNNAGGSDLKMTSIGFIGVLNPPSETTKASPFKTTFNWTPGLGEDGTKVLAVIFTDQLNASGFCTLAVTVGECPNFGKACYAGVGACQSQGKTVCQGNNVTCTAVPKDPQPELCNNIDDDCNGTVDDNNPQAGQPCTSKVPGLCSAGTTNCNAGVKECVPDVAPGSVAETCNGVDDDCDGTIDDGFGVGTPCAVGIGSCKETGTVACDGQGGTYCNALPDGPSPEVCNGLDDDCDGTIDNGLDLGASCNNGVGECVAAGKKVCDLMAQKVVCDAVPLPPAQEICINGKDEDCDGVNDNGCADADNDGLTDGEEVLLGTDPNDADSDDDGVLDKNEPSFNLDTDGDGLINALDPDSDDDGLFDGTELGLGCSNPQTNPKRGRCRPDGDAGATKTNPLSRDTDGGGRSDGAEDPNLNGVVDKDESDANKSSDDNTLKDFDGDGLSDALETYLGSNPKDADSDDDGLLDGEERNPSDDVDRDGLICVLDVDSDNDALFDGTEAGKNCKHPSTDAALGHCRADADAGATKTSPVVADTDHGGVIDGAEDVDLNGAKNGSELDPLDTADDKGPAGQDSDGDGLSDVLEGALGTSVNDTDSDDDGLPDNEEPNPSDDADGDKLINVLDPDSDGDGLFDGTEAGKSCSLPDTNTVAGHCTPDGDSGLTKTKVLVKDTDGGSVPDGTEDTNKNGIVDMGERDPLFAGDDVPPPPECTTDADCGNATSGKICSEQKCVAGCRGANGNGCPEDQVCSSKDATAGTCSAKPTDKPPTTPGNDGGCGCRTAANDNGAGMSLGLLLGLASLAGLRRRRR
jgi:MYXO-CTERM domain-containing protein